MEKLDWVMLVCFVLGVVTIPIYSVVLLVVAFTLYTKRGFPFNKTISKIKGWIDGERYEEV
jgi:hypothetical protein